jgi:hypothetical protein
MAICYNLWPFGIVCGHLLYFSQFGMFGPRKIWQPWWQKDGRKTEEVEFFMPMPAFETSGLSPA